MLPSIRTGMTTPDRASCRLVPLLLSCALALGALAGYPAPARCQDASDEPIEVLVVTGTPTPRPAYETPVSTALIDREELVERLQVQLLPEALVEVPGVMVQKTGSGQASAYLRGFTGFSNLLLIDGVRLNNSVFRPGPNQYWGTVDTASVERLEVSKGPAGSLYGSDAVGGTVQVITASPWREEGGRATQIHGRAHYRYGSADNSHLGRGEVSITRGEELGLLLGATPQSRGDLEAGGDVALQPVTGYDQLSFDAKLVARPRDGHKISALFQWLEQDEVPRTHKTIFAIPFEGTDVGSELQRDLDQARQLAYLQYHGEEPASFVDDLDMNVSWQRQKEERVRVRGDGRKDVSGFEVNTVGLFGRLRSDTRIGEFVYGLDYYRDFVSSERIDYNADGSLRGVRIQGPVADDAFYDLLGLHVQWLERIHPRFELNLGARYTYAAADAARVEDPETGLPISLEDSWHDVSGSARAMWFAHELAHVYASVNQGFRAPNLSDLTRLDSARSNEIQSPSLDLDPERFLGFELGAKSRGPRWNAALAGYYTLIFDGLIRTPTGRIIDGDEEVQTRNVGDGFVYGVELELSAELGAGFRLFGNLAYLVGKQDTYPTSEPVKETEVISRMQPLTGLAGLSWHEPQGRFWLEVSSRLAAAQDRLNTRDERDTQRIPPGGTPGYWTINLRGAWEITQNFSLMLALENLNNEAYRIHGSGITAPGRSVLLTGQARF